MTTYERAASGYDDEFEAELVGAILKTIARESMASDCRVIMLRTGETASALLTVLAGIIAMSPAATRSPTAIRNTIDELGKRLRRRIANAENSPDLQDFARRVFHGDQTEGSA